LEKKTGLWQCKVVVLKEVEQKVKLMKTQKQNNIRNGLGRLEIIKKKESST